MYWHDDILIRYSLFDILAIVDEFADGGITMARTKKYHVHLSDDDVKRLKKQFGRKTQAIRFPTDVVF